VLSATKSRRTSTAVAPAAASSTGPASMAPSQHRQQETHVHTTLPASAAAISQHVSSQASASNSRVESPYDAMTASPLHEVALSHLHKRASPLCLTCGDLAQGLDSARRLDALEWLVQAFDALSLSDAQLFSAFGLLDRFAAASPAPISAGPGAFAFVLAAMLVALKVSGTQRDLERAKRLVIEASGTPRPWAAVRKAELQILRRLGFRACTPTCLDFLERLLNEVFEQNDRLDERSVAGMTALDREARPGALLPRPLIGDLARLLLELGLVHEPEAVYGSVGHPPLASALAAMLLALLAFRAPSRCMEALHGYISLVDSGESVIGNLAEAMRTRWQQEERKCALQNGSSAVLEKWKRRMAQGTVGAQVPSLMDMRNLIPECPKDKAAAAEDSDLANGRRLRGKQPGASPLRPHQVPTPMQSGLAPEEKRGTSLLLAPATAVSRAVSGASERQSEQEKPSSSKNGPQANELPASAAAPSSARPSSTSGGSGGELTQRSSSGSGTTHGPAVAAVRYPSSQLVSALSRASAASENISSWPLSSAAQSQEGQATSPVLAASKDGAGALTQRTASTSASVGTSPEALVELTHVLNMVHPGGKPSLDGAANAASSGKPKPPTVASELLVSSALRLAWPPDRRKGVDVGVAASSCKEAAAVLEEAAKYLRNTAADLESGVILRNDLKGATGLGAGSESKRRRTFGGPSPPRAASPPTGAERCFGAPTVVSRGSPPVYRGIRV